jgi:hypothetical protein
LCDAETWTLRKVDQKYLKIFEMWCWRRMENNSWSDHVKNEEVLHRVKEDRNIFNTIKIRKAKTRDQRKVRGKDGTDWKTGMKA